MKNKDIFSGFTPKPQKVKLRLIYVWSLFLLVVSQFANGQIWTIGYCSGLPSTTQSSSYGPMYSTSTANATSRTTSIYPAAQLTGIAGQVLTSIYFHTGTGHAAGMLGTPNFKVWLKEVSALDWGSGALDWATASTGATLVFDGNPATLIGTGGGWKEFPLTTNFTYSGGTQNLAVFLEYKNTSASNAITWSYEFTAPCMGGNNVSKYSNNTTGTLATSLASSESRKAYIGFDFVVSCPAPKNIAVSGITQTGANITWTAGGTETSWDYAIQPAGGGVPTTFTNTSSNTLTPILTPNTNYDFYVRADCGGSNGTSVWKGPYNFKTLCGPMTTMFENFDSYATGSIVPDCWNRIVPAASAGSQTINSTTPASGTRNIYQYASTTQTPVIVVLPVFSNINAGTNWLRFKARITSGTGGALTVGYVTDATDAATFTTIQTLTINNTSYTAPDAEYTVVVPNTVPANARLAIKNAADAKTYYWDDVYWETTPTCLPPSGISVSGITTTSAIVSWTASSSIPSGGYTIYYSTNSTPPTSATVLDTTNSVTSNTTSATLNNLAASSTYYVWVRSDCGSGDWSTWKSASKFTTLCDIINGAYFEDFNSYPGVSNGSSGGVLPNCWTNLGTTQGGHISNSTTISGNTLYLWTSGTTYVAYVALPPMSTLQSGSYRLKFDALASVTAGGILQIGYLDTSNNFVQLTTFSVSTTNTVYPFSFDIPVLPAGVTQLALKNPGTPANSLSIDNLSYELQSLSTSEATMARSVKIYPNPFKDILNISDMDNVKTITVMDVSGRIVRTIEKVSSSLNLSDLKEGLYLVNLNYKDGKSTSVKVIKK